MSQTAELIEKIAENLSNSVGKFYPLYTTVVRFVLPLLALIVLIRCAVSLLRGSDTPEEWGYLTLPGGVRLNLDHWENTIGRAKSADVRLNYPTVSRSHGALIRDAQGRWTVYDLNSKTGILVNGQRIEGEAEVVSGDVINVGGADMVFMPLGKTGERIQAENREKPGRDIRPSGTLFLLTVFQALLTLQFFASGKVQQYGVIPLGFCALTAIMWLTFFFTRLVRRRAFEVETLAFLLTTVGFSVTATSAPYDMVKQVFFLCAGVVLYFAIGWFLRDLNRAKLMRWPIAAAGLLLLGVNLVLSEAVFGAKNWLSIGGFSFQPSEFVKICFIFAGAATLDRLFTKRNLILFIGFAGCCVMALVLMSDFGTGIIFFVTYLVIAFMRSGSIGTIFLSVGGAAFAGMLAISVKPYIKSRFSTWRHAWDFPNDSGYQQTRTMAACASGGLFGVGAGNGWLEGIVAANTDMVFGVVCEELGLIMALILVCAVIVLGICTVKYAGTARSSFYAIAAAAAASMFIFQMTLNVLGCVDILPFTGVTFPFVSKGGSSLIACWGILAFIKACDTRQNASFTVRMPKRVKKSDLYSDEATYCGESADYDFSNIIPDTDENSSSQDDFDFNFEEWDDD